MARAGDLRRHGLADARGLACGGESVCANVRRRVCGWAEGLQPGDRLDADRRIDNGCECIAEASADSAGLAPGERSLDANCDGADAEVRSSYYVANDGDDAAPGSVSRPLRSISRALELAHASLEGALPRPHVLVAAGTYTETLHVRDGVYLHGGYRRDFLARDLEGFETLVVATSNDDDRHGAALVVEPGGQRETRIEGLRLRGFDATAPGSPAIGAYVAGGHAGLTLSELRIRSGKLRQVRRGEGRAGRAAERPAAIHARRARGRRARVHGWARNTVPVAEGCEPLRGQDVWAVRCRLVLVRPRGRAAEARWARLRAGARGQGTDLTGPTERVELSGAVCCGLADFSVPSP